MIYYQQTVVTERRHNVGGFLIEIMIAKHERKALHFVGRQLLNNAIDFMVSMIKCFVANFRISIQGLEQGVKLGDAPH